jgi:transcriptional regulator with XRE-family HTH domain
MVAQRGLAGQMCCCVHLLDKLQILPWQAPGNTMSARITALGVVLKHLRTEARLSQEELAARANLSAKQISNLKRGVCATAHSQTLHGIACALNLSANDRALIEAAACQAGHWTPAYVRRTRAAHAGNPPARAHRVVLQLLTEIAARQAKLVELLATDVPDGLVVSDTARRPGGPEVRLADHAAQSWKRSAHALLSHSSPLLPVIGWSMHS